MRESGLESQKNSFPTVVPLSCPSLQHAVPRLHLAGLKSFAGQEAEQGIRPLPASIRRKPREGAHGL